MTSKEIQIICGISRAYLELLCNGSTIVSKAGKTYHYEPLLIEGIDYTVEKSRGLVRRRNYLESCIIKIRNKNVRTRKD
jgi:hypothetical protein